MTERPPGFRLGRKAAATYQGALEAVLAIVVAVTLGAVADSRFDTGPVFFLMGLAVGFGAFVLRLVRLLRASAADQADDPDEGPEGP